MSSSIFKRIFLTNVIIVLGVLSVVVVASTLFINWYYLGREQRFLEKQGQVICQQVQSYLRGEIDYSHMQSVVDALASTTTTRILVLEARPGAREYLQGKLGAEKSGQEIARIYERALHGEKVVERRAFMLPFHTSALLVAIPVLSDQQVRAVVFLYTPLRESADTLKGFYYIIWGCAAVALGVAALTVYLISRRLTCPITAMAAGARRLARGEEVPDFEVEGNDEIADLARAFNYMKSEIMLTESIRQDLITNVSHELRTPLTSVRGFIQAILEGVVPPLQEKKYLQLAYDELQRLIALVQDLLDLSRLRAGTIRLQWETVDLGQVAGRSLQTLQMLAADAGLTLTSELSPGILVRGDADRLCQVALNLIQNAIDYTPAGGQVRVAVYLDEGRAILAVTDNGPGIAESDLPRIFERFQRGPHPRTSGTGVGLAIVREIVERHGGQLEVTSQVGSGTEIRASFPRLTNV